MEDKTRNELPLEDLFVEMQRQLEERTRQTAPEEAPQEEPALETETPQEPEQAPQAPESDDQVTGEPQEAPKKEEPLESAPEQPEDSPTPPPTCDPQPLLQQILAQTELLAGRMGAMEELFSKRIAYTDHEEKTLDRMHGELQRYKEDLYFKLIKPILVDVLEMRDSITRMAELYEAKPEGQQDIPLKTFANYAYDLQEILEKNGIEIYRSEPGTDYVALRQRVVKKVPTQEEGLHGKVAQSITSGYLNGDKILSPEKVAVYLYEAPKGES